MSRRSFGSTLDVTLGEEGCAVVRRSDQSRPIIARALGVTTDGAGQVVRVVLDRRIHRPGESFSAGDWDVGGAVTSILSRRQAAVSGVA